jgi:hypothetical protein
VLPDAHHVVRTCKPSTVDRDTGRPTPASFEFRLGDAAWETFLSVHCPEVLLPDGELPRKVDAVRQYLRTNPFGLRLQQVKPNARLAVLRVGDIHAAHLEACGTTLQCLPAQEVEGDPHAGVHPNPGADHWPQNKSAPSHLAVQQFLYEAICHDERFGG